MAAKGSSSGHDMWTCMIQVSAAPIARNAVRGESTPIDNAGTASKKPTKKRIAAGSTYEGLLTCVENWSVQGAVSSHPQTSHRGSDGSRRQM